MTEGVQDTVYHNGNSRFFETHFLIGIFLEGGGRGYFLYWLYLFIKYL